MTDKPKKRVHITISQDIYDKVEETSERYGITPNAFISFIVGQWVDTNFNVTKALSDNVNELLPDMNSILEQPKLLEMVKEILQNDKEFKNAVKDF
jgi:hypothetical protein